MALSAGWRLGPYEIVAPLGAGGMGEVYRARDTRLQRDVALKVIAASSTADPERLRRFEQEARATAALNHPHIVAVFDIGHGPVGPFIVSELLEGETLRARLARGRLPLRTAIDIAAQLARGLAAAHDKEIVHRDLKPENVFVVRDGRTKILDFGLAKLRDGRTATDASQTATRTEGPARTEAGAVLGTVGYMAPEQVRGESADHRADIFALGCVLYEMLSGRRAFEGTSSVATLHAILTTEPPDLDKLGLPSIPGAVQRLVWRSLEKDPVMRFQSAQDLAFALETLADPSGSSISGTGTAAPGARPRRTPAYVAWSGAAGALLAVISLAASQAWRAPGQSPSIRAYLFHQEYAVVEPAFAFAPDGTRLAFAAAEAEERPLLRIRLLSGLADQAFAGTDGATLPFWSPDGQHVAFFADGKLKRVSIAGGAVQTLADAPFGRGGTWNQHGQIVFAPNVLGGLARVSAAGGAAEAVTQPASPIESHRNPWFLPDGRHFLFMRGITNLGVGVMTEQAIHVGALDTPETRVLMPSSDGSTAAYARPGFLLFRRSLGLYAQPFDADALRLTGEPVRLAESVTAGLADGTHFSVSQTGTLAFREAGQATNVFTLAWYSREGVPEPESWPAAGYLNPSLSPDGDRVAFVTSDTGDVWVQDLARGARTRVTFDGARHTNPVWSPDGRRLAFSCARAGSSDVHVKELSDSGDERVLVASADIKVPHAWSPDGRYVLYQNNSPSRAGAALWLADVHGAAPPAVWRENAFLLAWPAFSPDGQWVAYTSNESRRGEVYIAPFPGPGPSLQVSAEGGTGPMWRADGRELFFDANQTLMSVAVERAGESLRLGVPRRLFELPAGTSGHRVVTADGRRVLARTRADGAGPAEGRYVLVTNWPASIGQP